MLLRAQAYFDKHEFDPIDGYRILRGKEAKVGHIQLHVAKAALKMVMGSDDVIVREVMPDTAIYRSQLVNMIGQGAERHVTETVAGLSYSDDQNVLKAESKDLIVAASGRLATYLERLEHGEYADDTQMLTAAIDLHAAATGLAHIFGQDLNAAHLTRMQNNLGKAIPASEL